MSNTKIKLGFYWAASCGGCEIAVLDINEKILELLSFAEIKFWPVALDTKYCDVETYEDDFLDVCFFNGSVRNSEQEHLAKLLRKKSKILIAFGSCAVHGCIPGLANLFKRDEILETVYLTTATTQNQEKKMPKTKLTVADGELVLPEFYKEVKPLNKVVTVDYYIPGCPPPVPLIINAIEIIKNNALPLKGTILAPNISLCDSCSRNTNQHKIMPEIRRIYEIQADPKICFLEQGVICLGPVTRAGCETRCINGNWPCTGCMGPTDEIIDQGAKMISVIGSILKVPEEARLTDKELEETINKIKDPVGTFYMYSLATALVNKKIK
ncbi:MAG: oxidoreductase [candidate division WOR-3 bacterium]|nr:oxidoreductase [candidate division WOR-3 bacterium]MCX7757833.1 oxidoreductase [candidate division WOR-3 bacterium]